MNDASRRAIRSFLQIGLVQAAIALWNAFAAADLTTEQATAITLVATPLLVLLQNLLEDGGQLPSLLKAQASSGANPVTRDPA